MMKRLLLLPAFLLALAIYATVPAPAITSNNIEQLTSVTQLGRGMAHTISLSPDNKTLRVSTNEGTWVYDMDAPHVPLHFLENIGSHVVYSPDGQFVATWTQGKEDAVHIRNAQTGEIYQTVDIPLSAWLDDVVYNPDGQSIAVAFRGEIYLWDIQRGEILRAFGGDETKFYSMAYSPDGQFIAMTSDNEIHIWDLQTDQQHAVIEFEARLARAITYSPDGQQLAFNSRAGLLLYDLTDISLPPRITSEVIAFRFNADGSAIVFSSSHSADTDRLGVWDLEQDEVYMLPMGYAGRINSLTPSIDKQHLFFISNGEILMVHLQTGEYHVITDLHTYSVGSIAYSPDGRYVASGLSNNTIRLWDAETGDIYTTLTGHTAEPVHTIFSPDGNFIASASLSDIRIWHIETNDAKLIGQDLWGRHSKAQNITYSPNGDAIAFFAQDKLHIYDIQEDELRVAVGGLRSGVTDIFAYSPDGRFISLVTTDSVQVLDATHGDLHYAVDVPNIVSHIRYSPDGRFISLVTADSVQVLDATHGDLHYAVGISSFVSHVRYSPDGRFMAILADKTIKVLDANTGDAVFDLSVDAQMDSVHVAFSPDSRFLALDFGAGLQIIDVETGEYRYTFDEQQTGRTMAYHPNGTQIAIVFYGGIIALLDIPISAMP